MGIAWRYGVEEYMKPIFLKFPSGKIFTVLTDMSRTRDMERCVILFFTENKMVKYFDIDTSIIKDKFIAFYSSPTREGVEHITKNDGFYYICLCAAAQIRKFFNEKIFPLLDSGEKTDFIILSEEMSIKKDYFEIPDEFCPLFYIISNNQLVPVSYSPFSYNKIEIAGEKHHKELLSLGNEKDFTISYLQEGGITISPNFGELDNLYEIDAMDILVNSIMGHGKFKNITVLKDYNNYSMISDYTRKFPNVKNVYHAFAHMSNVLFDNDIIEEKSIGIVYDSISYDDSDQIRGGEILYGNIGNIDIIGGWRPLPLPGGDIANIEPWRIVLAVLREVTKGGLSSVKLPLVQSIRDNQNYRYIYDAINQGIISYSLSSSMHHIIAALGEVISYKESTYNFEYFENMMDNTIIEKCEGTYYDIPIIEEDGIYLLDTYDLFRHVVESLSAGQEPISLVCNIIVSIAKATAKLTDKLSKIYNENKISLAGEYFKHPHLLSLLYTELEQKGYQLYLPRKIPIDDSGISVGQLLFHYYENL